MKCTYSDTDSHKQQVKVVLEVVLKATYHCIKALTRLLQSHLNTVFATFHHVPSAGWEKVVEHSKLEQGKSEGS